MSAYVKQQTEEGSHARAHGAVRSLTCDCGARRAIVGKHSLTVLESSAEESHQSWAGLRRLERGVGTNQSRALVVPPRDRRRWPKKS